MSFAQTKCSNFNVVYYKSKRSTAARRHAHADLGQAEKISAEAVNRRRTECGG